MILPDEGSYETKGWQGSFDPVRIMCEMWMEIPAARVRIQCTHIPDDGLQKMSRVSCFCKETKISDHIKGKQVQKIPVCNVLRLLLRRCG